MTRNDQHDRLSRRRALAAGASLAAALAGCLGDDDEPADDTSEESDEDDGLEDDEAETDNDDGDANDGDADDSGEANGADDDAEESTVEGADSDGEEGSLELLAEEEIDHEHACLHAEFDEREPLEAGESAEEAATVEETHTIWEVAVEGEGEGYVAFDAAAHEHDGPFVFYTAGGSAEPVEGSEEERDDVPDDECGDLEEYVQVESEEGRIVLEVSPE